MLPVYRKLLKTDISMLVYRWPPLLIVTSNQIADVIVTSYQIADGIVTGNHITDVIVTSYQITDVIGLVF